MDYILSSVHVSLQILVQHESRRCYEIKRMETKQLIAKMKEINPYVESNIFKSVENVNLKTIIAYKKDGVKHSFLDTYDQEN